MSDLKGNEHIAANDDEFKQALASAKAELAKIPGVLGVGFGIKEMGGIHGHDIAILVYVSRKVPLDELPQRKRIPPSFLGYRTDVRVFAAAKVQSACNDQTESKEIHGGLQIEVGNKDNDPTHALVGTLGCLVRKRRNGTSDDNYYLLTNEHVLWDERIHAKENDGVYQPFAPRPTAPVPTDGNLLGKISRANARKCHVDDKGKPVLDEPVVSGTTNINDIDPNFTGTRVDAAIVHLDLGSFCCGSSCSPNGLSGSPAIPDTNADKPPGTMTDEGDRDRVKDVLDLRTLPASSVADMRVVKNGIKTGRTVGRIVGIGPAHSIVYFPLDGLPESAHITEFNYNVIEIVQFDPPPATNPCARDSPADTATNAFSWEGDSGSLLLDSDNNAVGLIFGGASVPNEQGVRKSHACLIVPVLDSLDICIPTTTGTSHGSSNATDGSGTAFFADAAGLPPSDDTQTLFARGTVSAPLPPTDDQRSRMLPLLDRLRETAEGRGLHEDFTQLSREIASLVRRCRPVTVTWHRHRGPAFLAAGIQHLKGEVDAIPAETGGITRREMLLAMERVLRSHGSNVLRRALDRHRDRLLRCADAESIEECLRIFATQDAEIPA